MNKNGLEETDIKAVVEAHGGAAQLVIQAFLLKDGKVATELLASEKLVVPPKKSDGKDEVEAAER